MIMSMKTKSDFLYVTKPPPLLPLLVLKWKIFMKFCCFSLIHCGWNNKEKISNVCLNHKAYIIMQSNTFIFFSVCTRSNSTLISSMHGKCTFRHFPFRVTFLIIRPSEKMLFTSSEQKVFTGEVHKWVQNIHIDIRKRMLFT